MQTVSRLGHFLETAHIAMAQQTAAAPMKWSPEDQRANIRRKMYNVESEEWLNDLPELENIFRYTKKHVRRRVTDCFILLPNRNFCLLLMSNIILLIE